MDEKVVEVKIVNLKAIITFSLVLPVSLADFIPVKWTIHNSQNLNDCLNSY